MFFSHCCYEIVLERTCFAMGDLVYCLDFPMLLVEVYFFFKVKVCMFFFICFHDFFLLYGK